MYTIILFDELNKCVDHYKNIIDPHAEGDNVYWQDGSIQGIQKNFIILEGTYDVEEDQDVSHLIELDIKDFLLPFEQAQIKQTSDMQTMINAILFDTKDFDQDNQINQMQVMMNDLMLGGL